ncbi:uncharacterized protein LOC135489924 [Lineus longissimus]|uniref:uncharacterized protein LOC135489924 n=1 Tax=Lineus longissimus TaxID=88925 RepID=UPI00315DE32F
MTALDSLELAIRDVSFNHDEHPIQRTLGVRWDVQDDVFVFVCQPKDNPMTKRGLVSTMSSVFDPCGYITPFTVRAKLLAQELWREGLGWDQPLPEGLLQKWSTWLAELVNLTVFKLPRHHPNFSPTVKDVELHIFSDASEIAFAAVAYLRYQIEDGIIVCSFLSSKSRVAPLKILSIPRLELQGALLAARLGKTLEDELKLRIDRKIHWTDSQIVLKYLNNGAKRFKPFVANRVAEILDITDGPDWRHVATNLNPADCSTRGLPVKSLTPESLWFQGPTFLSEAEENWPNSDIEPSHDLDPEDPEVKKSETLRAAMYNLAVDQPEKTDQPGPQHDLTPLIVPEDYSTLKPLLRRTAWIQRALRNFASAVPRLGHHICKEPEITAQEYEDATLHWVRAAQHDTYSMEVDSLKREDPLSPKSQLFNLMPFYDVDSQCIRVGGRLQKAPMPGDAKFQIILPAMHHVTRLIAADIHNKLWHGGQEHIIAEMRQQYWPVKARMVAKRAINGCFFCYLRKVRPRIPRMADLPPCRLDVTSGVFRQCGVDYWGPMMVKLRRSTVKRWGCLFTCMSTRAIHLELADSLESDDFLLCLRAFIGRRGHPLEMYSDNGTNFKGADKELSQCLQELNQNKIYGLLSPHKIIWHFNPPSAPHFGGAWERLVQSVKKALNTTDTVLRTALIEVEAVLNSRPLTHNSPDPSDYTALTPNHFIIGRADNKIPPTQCQEKEINSRRRWRQCQTIADKVCRRWQQEYLPKLTARDRWTEDNKSTTIGSLVMLLDEDAPRGHWELGRVIAVYPGDDGRVRAVDVKTARNTFRRPVAKICILEENV